MDAQSPFKRHVKIVATIGPATSSAEMLEKLIRSGMNVARLNLNYGTLEEHSSIITEIRRLSDTLGRPTGILLDLPGLKRGAGSMKEVFGEHLKFGLSQNADFLALSFISSARQVVEVREMLREMKAEVPVIVKIEQAPALEESSTILALCDGLMVARGDLANEISIERVPLAQKKLIKEANCLGKPVITATQMLESMVRSNTPTRAEATDVANAVLDGTDALMLSEETAIGRYPVEAVEMMARIALEAEAAFPYQQMLGEGGQEVMPEVNDATARAACQMAHQVRAKAIVAFTAGGSTALRVSRYRPRQPILAVTPSETVVRRLSLSWGIIPARRPALPDLEMLFDLAREIVLAMGIAQKGDLVVITAGIPLKVQGSTNLVKIHAA